MVMRGTGALLLSIFMLLGTLAGCGPSQEEYDSKVREVEDLKARLDAAR